MDSESSKKACDVGSGSGSGSNIQFPAGLRVLVVDDDPTCLKILEKMLRKCLYEVITCSRAVVALDILRERNKMFDVVISDVHMPDMDGFKLLEHIGLEMDLPVIMMSVDDKKEVVMKGVTHGACDYLIKPVRIEAIRNIWQHVVRKRRNELRELEQSGSFEEGERNRRPDDAEYTSSANDGSWKSSKKRKDDDDDGDDRDDTSTLKKPRVVWSVELHQQFVAAVNSLSIDKAVPKKILELMNVPGLTRENVASHLQKYRLYLRRISGSPNPNGHMPFMCSPEANYGTPSFDGLDLQALAVTGQLQPNSFATLQAGGLARSSLNTGIGIPHLDQRNPYSSEVSKLRFGGSQQLTSNNKQADLYHGLPTTIQPKQLTHLHQSIPSSSTMGLQGSEGVTGFVSLPSLGTNSMNNHNSSVPGMMHMAQSRPRGQLLNDSTGTSFSMGQQIFSNDLGGHMLGGRNMNVLNGRAALLGPSSSQTPFGPSSSQIPFGPSSSQTPFGPSSSHTPFGPSSSRTPFGRSSSQASSMLDFQRMNHNWELPGNSFPMGNPPTGVSTLQPKGPRGYQPTNYNIFNEHPQNVDITFEASQHPRPLQNSNNINFSSPVMAPQGLLTSSPGMAPQGLLTSSTQNNDGLNSSNSHLLGEGTQFGPSDSLSQHNSFRVKTESTGDVNGDNIYLPQHTDQGDLMSAILRPQGGGQGENGGGQGENDFNFDGYSLDDVSV